VMLKRLWNETFCLATPPSSVSLCAVCAADSDADAAKTQPVSVVINLFVFISACRFCFTVQS